MKIIFRISLVISMLIGGAICLVMNPILWNTKSDVDISVSTKRLYADVEALASIMPARNAKNLASLDRSADYIFKNLEEAGCRMERQFYSAGGETYQNIIGSIGPETGSRIIVGAHYDVCEEQPGADDNASAVAGLLEVARLIHKYNPELKQRIDFVGYTLEEPPYFGTELMGSAIHAKSLKAENVEVDVMICLEMIGYFSDEENSQDYPIGILNWFYPSKGNFIAVISKFGQGSAVRKVKKSMRQVANIKVKSINAPASLHGIDFSDHRNYWAQGYDALMINNTAFYRNKNYHKKSDSIETLDFDRMGEVVKGAYWAIINY